MLIACFHYHHLEDSEADRQIEGSKSAQTAVSNTSIDKDGKVILIACFRFRQSEDLKTSRPLKGSRSAQAAVDGTLADGDDGSRMSNKFRW